MNAEQAQGLLNFFLPTLETEFTTTKRVIAAVPQATCEYKPDAKSKTGRELAWHIAAVEVFFLDGIFLSEPSRKPSSAYTRRSCDEKNGDVAERGAVQEREVEGEGRGFLPVGSEFVMLMLLVVSVYT